MIDREDRPKEKKKWTYDIHSWYGRPREGVWVPESVATNVKRVFKRIAKAADWTKRKPVSVIETVEEIVYANHGYRPKLDKEKTARKAFFFRGARVWRA